MVSRKSICILAASFLGLSLASIGSNSSAMPREVVIEGQRIPILQRRVSYTDLDLTVRADQRAIDRRILRTAKNICIDLNGVQEDRTCIREAVHSTDDQVTAAIERAQRTLAGDPARPAAGTMLFVLQPRSK